MSMDIDIDAPLSIAPVQQVGGPATIFCCDCGAPIDGTVAIDAKCYDCFKLTKDISQGIQREATLHTCRDCDRWLQPPSSWVTAQPESRELLALCLRKLSLNRTRIIDASFIWTEPHSRRVRVKLVIQAAVADDRVMQQALEVVYVVAYQQCPECAKSYTANVWRANVQVRQKVLHKRTFLYLEQLILKHGAHRETINIKEAKDGIDFFFSARNQAEKFVDFLNSVVPVRVKKSQELISQDTHTSKKSYKFTFSVELIPVCKDDLVALPIPLAKQVGSISPLAICYRIGTSINLLDPNTLQTAEISAPVYWRAPFTSLADSKDLVEFVVMDCEPVGPSKGKWIVGEVQVARAADLGVNDQTYFARTHLGGLLRAGDFVLGYMLTGTNFNNPELEALEESHTYASRIPDVVIVKKHYPEQRRRRHGRGRQWKLKRMARDEGEMLPRKQDQERADREFELFLRDIEEDAEFRAGVQLYKKPRQPEAREPKQADEMSVATEEDGGSGGDGDDDDIPRVDMDELLDDFDELTMEER
ncbi:NMD3-domain-containing protein [Durotheca rogersii]|uniref:NMD3-domain-containing protein n=1 Tax=Durotheca rogersii TaxID=419775 RepID=UPI00222033EB|nr:NMD3-domain-containing protein [Durotheca rogersii]KAI5861590.1 NMD3-domain-containing protein [Durotheca rogersii]